MKVGHEERPCAERLGDVAGGVRHRLADRRLLARPRGSRAGSRGSARPRARSDPSSATASTGYSPTAVSPESISADVPSRIAFATSDASARVGSGAWIIDSSICVAVITGFPRSSAREDDPLLEERHRRGADLDAEIAARDHHRVGLARIVVERLDRLGLLDLGDHVRGRAGRLDQRPQRLDVGGRAHERERDEVDAELERELRGRRCPSASTTGSAAARPGRLTPLCELPCRRRRRRSARGRARPRSTRRRTARRRSGRRCRAAGPRRSRRARPAGRRRCAASSPATTISSPRASSTGVGSSPIRSFGPWRSAISASGRPSSPATSRTSRAASA